VARLEGLGALEREIISTPASRFRWGEVRSLTSFGAFVRLCVSERAAEPVTPTLSADALLKQLAAATASAAAIGCGAGSASPIPLSELRTRTSILPKELYVDGLIGHVALQAAFRKGIIGAAGAADGIAAGMSVRVHVESLDVHRGRVALSLCDSSPPPPPMGTSSSEVFPALHLARPSVTSEASYQCSPPLPTPIPSEPSPPLPLPHLSPTLDIDATKATDAAFDAAKRLHAVLCADAAIKLGAPPVANVLFVRTLRRLRRCATEAAAPSFRSLILATMPWKEDATTQAAPVLWEAQGVCAC